MHQLASRSNIQSSSSTFHDIAIEDDSNCKSPSLFDYNAYEYDHVDDLDRIAIDDHDNIGDCDDDVNDDSAVEKQHKCRSNHSLSRENVSMFEVKLLYCSNLLYSLHSVLYYTILYIY